VCKIECHLLLLSPSLPKVPKYDKNRHYIGSFILCNDFRCQNFNIIKASINLKRPELNCDRYPNKTMFFRNPFLMQLLFIYFNFYLQGGEVVQETITSNIHDDIIILEFQRTDGTLITQLIDFRSVSKL
jgi:hypothetical protein